MYKMIPECQCQIRNLADIYNAHLPYRTDGTFVEVGAFDGFNWSNTYMLAQIGWRGILFEPQPEQYQKLVERYCGILNITTERCCIGSENRTARLYLGGSLSTTVAEMVDVYNSMEWSKFSGLDHERYIDVPMYTLDNRLEYHGCPRGFDVLVVDVEGAEMDVLSGFTIGAWKPTLAIVETHEEYPDERLSGKAALVNAYFDAAGYEKIQTSTINAIYRRIDKKRRGRG